MPHFITWPLHWMGDNPYQTIFYLLTIVVSIFGRDIRTFLSIPPQRLSVWILKTRIRDLEYNLKRLDKVHDDAYQLLMCLSPLFLLVTFVFSYASVITIFLVIVAIFPSKFLNIAPPHPHIGVIYLSINVLALILFVRFGLMYSFLDSLQTYTSTKQRWEDKAKVLTARLER